MTTESEGTVSEIRDSPLDIFVNSGHGGDLIVKVGDDHLLLSRKEARDLADPINNQLMADQAAATGEADQ